MRLIIIKPTCLDPCLWISYILELYSRVYLQWIDRKDFNPTIEAWTWTKNLEGIPEDRKCQNLIFLGFPRFPPSPRKSASSFDPRSGSVWVHLSAEICSCWKLFFQPPFLTGSMLGGTLQRFLIGIGMNQSMKIGHISNKKWCFRMMFLPKRLDLWPLPILFPSNSLQEPPLVTLVRSKARPDPKG